MQFAHREVHENEQYDTNDRPKFRTMPHDSPRKDCEPDS